MKTIVECRYSKQGYFNKLRALNILPIDYKFLLNDLLVFFTIVNKNSVIAMPHFLINKDNTNNGPDNDQPNYFQRQTRNFNASDLLKFKCKIIPRVNAFKNSFFHRSYMEWNKLPPEIRSAESKQVFKAHLEQHLWLVAESNLDTD